MKRKPFGLALLSAAALGAVLFASCKKENHAQEGRAVTATQVPPSSPILSGVLGTTHNAADTILLTSGTVWHLSGLVYVDSADVLIIQPGTVIKGDLSGSSTVAGGGLIITKGAKILAQGTAANPIVFTSNSSTPQSGDWSGVVLLGKAPTNAPTTTRVEGVPDVSPADATFGGNVPNDNSGILQFVRIEYAGFALSLNNELNGLTLAGVGSGTVIDYVEVFKANDDAFEFFGGTVNASHLLAIDALDDMFDTDNGYIGTISYALGLSDTTRADQSESNGFESDNNAGGTGATPITRPTYNYVTIVGLPNATKAANGAGGFKYGRAAHLRRNAEFNLKNSIFVGFSTGISLDQTVGTTYDKYVSGVSVFTNNFVHGYVRSYAKEVSKVFTVIGTPTGNFGTTTLTNISLTSPFDRSGGAASFFAAEGTPEDQAGAFPNGADWTTVGGSHNWTRYN